MTQVIEQGRHRVTRPSVLDKVKGRADVLKWKLRGKPLPPPHAVKVALISQVAQKFGCKTLVETGTYLGDMIARTRHLFDRLITIEVDELLHRNACKRFQLDSAITVLHGDSTHVLPQILASLTAPAIFWLDGHYSGGNTGRGDLETPVEAEVDLILGHPVPGHVILVDDARLFDGTADYPTLGAFREKLLKLQMNYSFAVESDIIRFEPTPCKN